MFEIDIAKKSAEMQKFITETVKKAGFNKVVVAVSGGVDSATALFLAVKAMGVENVYAVLLPYGDLSSQALEHGKMVVQAAGLIENNIFVRNIKPGVDKLLEQTENIDEIRKGNMMARVRMIYLFDLAKELGALVVGTENKSEHYLGYFTRFGDEASDMEPIRSLYKTQVWEMAKYLGVPQKIVEKAPSANLWEGQKDEGEFGFSYADADKVLYHYFEEKLPIDGIIALGLDKNVVEKVLEFVKKNDFKHHVPHVLD